ncbi:hypothetical protein SAMN05660862_2283 [Sphingobacterium psychroaquaticum]|uniref:Uncharacterized protein n=1 Tax=Sphingobacterium psychroaquaticum TaxID=561061 RepID=A0A1X7JY93_9SPHI|nr:hypothetical protein SAMN05660862_2283 [Sphingobacterium psychroaquaticum]
MQNTNYHCDSCPNGVVVLNKRETGTGIRLSVQNCNVCGKEYGLKESAGLVKVGKEVKNA